MMSETISVSEHEVLPVVANRVFGQRAISEVHAGVLKQLENQLPARSFSWGYRSVKFGHFCGVLALGEISIEVLPKIYGKEGSPGSSRTALVHMLYRARRLKPRAGGSATISLQSHFLLDVFVSHFCDQLHAELMQGMIHRYARRIENLHVLRGRLRVEQQLRHNFAYRERLYCEFDEFLLDNRHNRVLKYVLRLLTRLALGAQARMQVSELLMRFDGVNDVPVTIGALERLEFDRSNDRYRTIFEQCRWFLLGLHPDVLAGRTPALALLFDMNRLFESYAAASLRRVTWANGLALREQGPQRYFVRRGSDERELFLMKPDLAFISGKRIVALADAKWKLLDERETKMGIAQSDLYQMASYAARYGVDRLALIYPRQQFLQEPSELHVNGTKACITILPFDVSAPFGDGALPGGLAGFLDGTDRGL